MLTALRNEGVNVSEYKGWKTHERDDETGKTFGPVNMVLIHHTAGTDSLDLCFRGRAGLPGPLAHAHLSKTGVTTLLSAGRANHAGNMAKNAFDSFLNESKTHPKPSASSGLVDGNDRAYGIEIENRGTGKDPYPAVQYDQAVRWAAAICRFHKWTADSVGGHKETSVEGKIDPSFDMNQFRRDVAERLAHAASWDPEGGPERPAAPKPPAKATVPTVSLRNLQAAARRDPSLPNGGTPHPKDVKPVETALDKLNLLSPSYAKDGSFGSKTVSAYAAYQRRIGYRGADADGIPGAASLARLARDTGLFKPAK